MAKKVIQKFGCWDTFFRKWLEKSSNRYFISLPGKPWVLLPSWKTEMTSLTMHREILHCCINDYNSMSIALETFPTNSSHLFQFRIWLSRWESGFLAAPTTIAEIRYPNGTKSPDDFYPINSIFTCIGDGYPPPTVAWIDGNTNSVIGQQRQRSVSWMATAPGAYNLTCAAKNTLATNTTYNATIIYVEGKQFYSI